MGNVYALTRPRELSGQHQLWSAVDIVFSLSQFLTHSFWPLTSIPSSLLFLISVLGSVTHCFIHWAASSSSMYFLHLQYENSISFLAEALARLNEMMLSPTLLYIISSISCRYCDTDYLLIWLSGPKWLKCKYLLSTIHLDYILPCKSVSIDTCFSPLKSFTFPHTTAIKDAEGLGFYIERGYLLFFFFLTFVLLSLFDFGSHSLVSSKFLPVPGNLGYLGIWFPNSHLLHHVILHSVRMWTSITNFVL